MESGQGTACLPLSFVRLMAHGLSWGALVQIVHCLAKSGQMDDFSLWQQLSFCGVEALASNFIHVEVFADLHFCAELPEKRGESYQTMKRPRLFGEVRNCRLSVHYNSLLISEKKIKSHVVHEQTCYHKCAILKKQHH